MAPSLNAAVDAEVVLDPNDAAEGVFRKSWNLPLTGAKDGLTPNAADADPAAAALRGGDDPATEPLLGLLLLPLWLLLRPPSPPPPLLDGNLVEDRICPSFEMNFSAFAEEEEEEDRVDDR